jgi:hypothetical protein
MADKRPNPKRIPFLKLVREHMVNRKVVEIGVQKGFHAQQMLTVLKPTLLLLVDRWGVPKIGYSGKNTTQDEELKFNINYRELRRRMGYPTPVKIAHGYSLDVVKTQPDNEFAVVYVDADHSFDAVLADLESWWCKVAPGGILCGHDWGYRTTPDVAPAVKRFMRARDLELWFGPKVTEWAIKKPR